MIRREGIDDPTKFVASVRGRNGRQRDSRSKGSRLKRKSRAVNHDELCYHPSLMYK